MATVLLFAASGGMLNAATPSTFNILCINRTDGATERLMLHKALEISISPEGNICLQHPDITVEIPSAEVSNFTFERNDKITDVYDGDHRSAIDAPEAAAEGLSITPDEISSCADIRVYDLKGVQVAACSADGGRAVLATSSLPSGIYIVKSGSTTLKIKL